MTILESFLLLRKQEILRILLKNPMFSFKQANLEYTKYTLDLLLENMEFYPKFLYLKIYSSNGQVVYQQGRDILTTSPLALPSIFKNDESYQKTFLLGNANKAYEIFIPHLDNDKTADWHLNLLFDLESVDTIYFKERRMLFLIVFILNLLIVAFLMMMVLNLQKRLFIKENELSNLTVTDKLTSLYAKDAFFNELKNEINRTDSYGGRFSIITADIDNFSDINARCGADFGDLVLKNVAQSFKKIFRKFDTIGRFGGDEIIVLVIGANEKEAVVLAEQSRVAITETTFFFEGELVPVTMSFGVIDSDKCKPNGRDGETRRRNLLRDIVFNSLNALSRAKRTGKNKVVRFGELKKDNEVNIV